MIVRESILVSYVTIARVSEQSSPIKHVIKCFEIKVIFFVKLLFFIGLFELLRVLDYESHVRV